MSQSGRLVLVVDDFPESVDAVFALLVERGFTVALALDGEDAIRTALMIHPDVIVMDLAMPRCDGLEALRRLKAGDTTRHIPVILFSAHAGPELLFMAEQLGCSAVVKKPSGSHAVVDAVAKLVGDREAAAAREVVAVGAK